MLKNGCLLSLLLCFLVMSCSPVTVLVAGTAIGIGGYKYHQGGLNTIFKASYKDTWNATVVALKKMEMDILKKDHDTTSGKISTKLEDSRTVNILIQYKTSDETDVRIRVGLLGDEDASIIIKDGIAQELF